MAGVMVFIPSDRHGWQAGLDGATAAHAATGALREAFGVSDDEEAEYAALTVASVAGLVERGNRFVLGAEVSAEQVDETPDTGNGEVVVSGIRRSQIVSWFTDESSAEPLLRAAAQAAQGHDVDEAWQLDQVQALISEHALLWHAAEELEN